MQPHLVILIGNIGSGKSTLCKKYSEQGFDVVCRDAFRSIVFGEGRYIYNPNIEKAIDDFCIRIIKQLLDWQVNLVIDETNMNRKTRQRYISLAKACGYKIVAHETFHFTKDESIANRTKDDLRGYTPELWGEVWEKFNRVYQTPTLEEGFDKIIREESKNG